MNTAWKTILQNLAAVVLVVAIVALVNGLAVLKPLRFDVTQEKEFTLTPATRQILHDLKDRLTIKLYYSKNLPAPLQATNDAVTDLLDELRANSSQAVIVEHADPDSNDIKEQEAQALGLAPLQVNIVEKDQQQLKKIYMGMVIYYRDKKAVIPVLAQVDNLEYVVALNVLKLTSDGLPKIGLLPPQTDQENFSLLPLVLNQISQVVPIDPADKKLSDKKIKALIVVKPENLSADFLKQVDDLIVSGVNVVFFAGRTSVGDALVPAPLNTGLDDWLKAKGVAISEQLFADVQQNAQAVFNANGMQVMMPYPFWAKAEHVDMSAKNPITAQLEELLLPWSNVVQKNDAKSDWVMTPLVSSSEGSFLAPENLPDISPQSLQGLDSVPEMKSYPVFVMLNNSKDKSAGRIALMANSTSIQDLFLKQAEINAVFLQNLVEDASWGDKLIGIRSRGKTARPLAQLSEGKRSALKWFFVAGIPLLAVAGVIGANAWRKRKTRLWLVEQGI